MAYKIDFRLPEGWTSFLENYDDESGVEISHLEARKVVGGRDVILVDVYAGPMPEGETAEDQAFANYADTIGFDDDDEQNPIVKYKFNNRNAWGYDGVTEEECPMRFLAQEVRKGVFAIIVFYADTEDILNETFSLLERSLRISL